MSTPYEQSVWEQHPENTANAPRICPHCEQTLAHADDLRNNDDIGAAGYFSAYRAHRQVHFEWGEDPRTHGSKPGDPYLASYYDTSRDALWDPDDNDDQPAGDPDEVVGEVFDVDIRYEATVRARVVAPSESRAKEKAKDMRLGDVEDLTGSVPEAELTMELHTNTRSVKDVHRADTELAERMDGWPW